jgi:hypothetical protein
MIGDRPKKKTFGAAQMFRKGREDPGTGMRFDLSLFGHQLKIRLRGKKTKPKMLVNKTTSATKKRQVADMARQSCSFQDSR